jgi:hypothetical protein
MDEGDEIRRARDGGNERPLIAAAEMGAAVNATNYT